MARPGHLLLDHGFGSARDDRLHADDDNCMVLPDRPHHIQWRSHGILLLVLVPVSMEAVLLTISR